MREGGRPRDAGFRTGLEPELEAAIAALAGRFDLPEQATGRLMCLVNAVATDPHVPTTVRAPMAVVHQHLADSLVALELAELDRASVIADIGSGAGFPGLPLALARPQTRFVLLEGNRRKCSFMERAARECGAENAEVVNARAEEWREGRNRCQVVTARAVAALGVVMEYAAPLLAVGGVLVAWRGRREPEAERAAGRAAPILGLELTEVRQVQPFPGAKTRYLHVISKVIDTPSGFPRRPGMAAKRPLGMTGAGAGAI